LKIKTIILAGTFLFLTEIFGQGVAIKTWRGFPSSPNKEWAKWADSVLKTLPLRKQIGQMMMVAVWSNKGAEHINETEKLIYDYGIGGLCFFQGHPLKQAYQTNYYQQISSLPLLVSIR
jgi:hypothetical protein